MASNDVINSVANLSDLPHDLSPTLLQHVSLKSKQVGFKYFSEGYIHDVKMYKIGIDAEDAISMKCKCYRSMKKNEKPHQVFLDITSKTPGRILTSHCTCQAG